MTYYHQPGSSLITLDKSFTRPLLDFEVILYHQSINASFPDEIESIQYNAVLGIAGATKGIQKQKLFQELGLESLKERRWFCPMCHLYQIILYEIVPALQRSHHYPDCFKPLLCQFNKLDPNIKNID